MDAFLGEIRLFPYAKVPSGWLECKGQLLPVREHGALYHLIANTYGGEKDKTFALPDLRGRAVVGAGTVSGTGRMVGSGQSLAGGQTGGAERVALTSEQMPPHRHEVLAEVTNSGSGATPNTLRNAVPSTARKPASAAPSAPPAPAIYGTADPAKLQPLAPDSVMVSGAGAPHENRQPYLPLIYCICSSGIYPVRS